MNFVQLNGIPQGGNASPILADLTLTGMEIKFMQSQNCDRFKKELSLTFRYIDDFLLTHPFFRMSDMMQMATEENDSTMLIDNNEVDNDTRKGAQKYDNWLSTYCATPYCATPYCATGQLCHH
ncbi:hypothetical protein DdX_13236 [Ditylenchus destructor]|uniref:Telomerase catalytic subunit n=1 Tax=Ditylenchus destructor TaxID=166010 RepID=A0AAD4MX08_9BILA|nr:hypothetical protein DdX_13236 [Ditylenchus destructor]